ncbi:hypothetical protein AB0891_25505 [Streptomyces sp. NPDC007259]|uniref:hypothetical protein n=1 Tax=Streptomyces sp. NPDC007259 TaxID=3154319 RepID=UPI003454BB0A
MTTPADELLAAAALLRTHATAAHRSSPAPWTVTDEHGVRCADGMIIADRSETDHPAERADLPYIAAMNPVVGLTVAKWLEAVSYTPDDESLNNPGSDRHDGCSRDLCVPAAALAVARQVLGTPTTDTAPADCSCGGRGPLDHLHADAHEPASAPAAPALEPQDHPGADLFVALRAAGLDADEAHRRMYAYAAMVLRQEQATAAGSAAVDVEERPDDAARRFARRLHAVEQLCSGRPGYHTITVKALLTAMSDADDEPATAATEEHEHGHVWVTALDGDNRPIHDEHGRPVTHCGICGQHPVTTATEAARCTCADAGPEFAPAGHYADCPHAATAAPEEPQP